MLKLWSTHLIGKRSYSTRVRMAPSPTGKLHLGGLRTSLFNYLFAKKQKGTFILRIEDTDQTRLDPEAEENIFKCLDWAKLTPDEARDIGEYGPYKQSLRTDIYKKYANQLLESGHAYRCYCSAERLDAMRHTYAKKGLPSFYDRACLSLPVNQKNVPIPSDFDINQPHTIRLKIPEGETTVYDEVAGKVQFKNDTIDDQVLLKSDGFPTYHLANVIDDHLMKITHVIRGEEWLPSTPKHVLLYKAFGWEPPKWVHLPLLLNTDRTKLSKRKGDVSVDFYIESGYLPSALINFVALLGWNPGQHDYQEIFYTQQELIDKFSIDAINNAPAVVDIQKLKHINGKHMQYFLNNSPEEFLKLFTEELTKYAAEKGLNKFEGSPEYIAKVLSIIQNTFTTLKESIQSNSFFFFDPIYNDPDFEATLDNETAHKVFSLLEGYLKNPEVVSPALADIKKLCQTASLKPAVVLRSIRYAVTGNSNGIDLGLLFTVLTKDLILTRLNHLINKS